VILVAIIYKKEPDEAAEAMRTSLKRMADKRAFRTPLLHKAVIERAEEPVPEHALPVYHLGLSDLAEEKDVRAAVHTGWRHIIRQNNEIVAHGETIVDPKGIHHFAAVNEGPLVKGISNAIETAERQDVIIKGQYEPRVLLVPSLHVAALWLVDKDGKLDYAMPIEPVPAPLVTNKIVPLEDLLTFLQNKAKSVSATAREDNTLGGS
jgi:hypothetical protein